MTIRERGYSTKYAPITPAIAPLAPTIGTTRIGLHDRLRERRGDAAQQVEHEEAAVAHPVLDVVAEDPEVQHVAADVQQAAVQEHRGEHRHPRERRRHQAEVRA